MTAFPQRKNSKKKEQYLETEENVYEVTGFKKEI